LSEDKACGGALPCCKNPTEGQLVIRKNNRGFGKISDQRKNVSKKITL
jgi:hypothetical protein